MFAARLNTFVVVLLLSGTLSAQVVEVADEPWLSKELTTVTEGDDELQKLLKARHGEAISELKSAKAVFDVGGGQGIAPLLSVVEASSRTKTSALELCRTSAQRIKVLEKNVKVCKAVEKAVSERFEQGTDPAQAIHRTRYWRLDGEIELLRAKREADKDK